MWTIGQALFALRQALWAIEWLQMDIVEQKEEKVGSKLTSNRHWATGYALFALRLEQTSGC